MSGDTIISVRNLTKTYRIFGVPCLPGCLPALPREGCEGAARP